MNWFGDDKMTFDLQKAKDLAERAREHRVDSVPGQTGYGIDHSKYPEYKAVNEICSRAFTEAIREIEALQDRIDALEEALGPLAAAADNYDDLGAVSDDMAIVVYRSVHIPGNCSSSRITVGDARRARAALRQKTGEEATR